MEAFQAAHSNGHRPGRHVREVRRMLVGIAVAGVERRNGVATMAPDDAWAVGGHNASNLSTDYGSTVPLVEHWNGAAWSLVEAPFGDPPVELDPVSQ